MWDWFKFRAAIRTTLSIHQNMGTQMFIANLWFNVYYQRRPWWTSNWVASCPGTSLSGGRLLCGLQSIVSIFYSELNNTIVITFYISPTIRSDVSSHLATRHTSSNGVITAICCRCPTSFGSFQELYLHYLCEHDRGLFQCRHVLRCEFIGETRSAIIEHVNEHFEFGEVDHENFQDLDEQELNKLNPLSKNKEFQASLKKKLHLENNKKEQILMPKLQIAIKTVPEEKPSVSKVKKSQETSVRKSTRKRVKKNLR